MSLSINTSPVIAAIAAVIALGVTLLYYRRTVPPIPRGRKIVLSTLRFLGLFLLFLFLLEPVLHNIFSTNLPPRVAVLIDNSQSMTIADATGDRVQKEKDIIRAAQQSKIAGNVQSYLFGDSLHPRQLDSLGNFSASSATTNISSALNAIEKTRTEQNVQAVVLVTDGEYTAGENPLNTAENIPVPVYAIGIGDSSEQRDIRINSVITNDVALLGATVPIDVTIHSKGFDNQQVSVTLTDDNQPAGTQQVMLHGSTEDYSCSFTVTPKTAGTHKFKVAVTALAGELTDKNNSKIFFVRVIDNKVKIALFAGAPGPDVSFVMQTLASNENISVAPFIQKEAGEFYVNPLSSSDFTNADCIVMVGFPIASTNSDVIHAIAERVRQKNVPLLLVWGKDVAPAK
ncbi:MAG TPA: hypothetical protein VFJ29_02450, partial [Candidatus Kapabacteria bacterium]|nr:hypothetical protein [Candidatus Kapabacteria bacterium]